MGVSVAHTIYPEGLCHGLLRVMSETRCPKRLYLKQY